MESESQQSSASIPQSLLSKVVLNSLPSKQTRGLCLELSLPQEISVEDIVVENLPNIIQDIITYLSNRKASYLPGLRHLILYGPLGTGKTTCARYLAHKTNSVLFDVDATDLKAESSVPMMFEDARSLNHSVLLAIHQFERIDEKGSILNELLYQLSDLSNNRIFLVGMTRFIKDAPPRIFNSGRFDTLPVILPDRKNRLKLLSLFLHTEFNKERSNAHESSVVQSNQYKQSQSTDDETLEIQQLTASFPGTTYTVKKIKKLLDDSFGMSPGNLKSIIEMLPLS